MSCEGWKEVRIVDIANVKGGKRLPKGINLIKERNKHPYIRIRDLGGKKRISLNDEYEYVDDVTQKLIARYTVNTDDIIISIVGSIGFIGKIDSNLNNANLTENCVKLIDLKNVDNDFLYYFLISDKGQEEIKKRMVGAVQAKLPIKNIQAIRILLPPFPEQKAIAATLSCLDDKIEVNNRINKTLEEMAQAIFKSWFVDFEPFQNGELVDSELGLVPKGWVVKRSGEIYDISIGKTPPRKETQWFTDNSEDIKWVSISDMGKGGIFISNTSEYLTQEAVHKFNIIVVPENTVLLSFKLTIGRISITDIPIATNEAIAQFKTTNSALLEYTYLTLKNFSYASLGNTSSIATAVNSKIIKAMPILLPSNNVLDDFHQTVVPLFNQIRANQKETQLLSKLRDSLLPKLMSGEIRCKNE
jgi:type I restriction enzyme S subunit